MHAIAVLIAMQTTGTTCKVPIANFDTSSPVAVDLTATYLPKGFIDVKPGDGVYKGKIGTITMKMFRSTGPIPNVQRNPKAKKGEVWSTIRLVKWIGFRNSTKNTEEYQLDWSRYRLKATLSFTDKKNLVPLRKALNLMVDGLPVK